MRVIGGTAITEEIFPGFKTSLCADTAGYLSDEVKADLKLDSQVEFIPLDPIASSPEPDGTHLTIWRDTAKTVKEIERFSPADAAKYPEFVKQMTKIAGVVEGLLKLTPMDLPSVSFADIRAALSLAGPVLKLGRKNINQLMRVLPTPVEDLLNERGAGSRHAHHEDGGLRGGLRTGQPLEPLHRERGDHLIDAGDVRELESAIREQFGEPFSLFLRRVPESVVTATGYTTWNELLSEFGARTRAYYDAESRALIDAWR